MAVPVQELAQRMPAGDSAQAPALSGHGRPAALPTDRAASGGALIADLSGLGAEASRGFAIEAAHAWAEIDPEGYAEAMQEFVAEFLREEGFFQCLRALAKALGRDDVAGAEVLAQRLLSWAAKFPAASAEPPEEAATSAPV